MNRAIPVIALGCAALCACEAKPVADVHQNGLVEVNPLLEPLWAMGGKGQSVKPLTRPLVAEIRNGTPVALLAARIRCTQGEFIFYGGISKPLAGGSRIKVAAAPKLGVDPILMNSSGPMFCGFSSAELDKAGIWVWQNDVPQQTIPSPEFH